MCKHSTYSTPGVQAFHLQHTWCVSIPLTAHLVCKHSTYSTPGVQAGSTSSSQFLLPVRPPLPHTHTHTHTHTIMFTAVNTKSERTISTVAWHIRPYTRQICTDVSEISLPPSPASATDRKASRHKQTALLRTERQMTAAAAAASSDKYRTSQCGHSAYGTKLEPGTSITSSLVKYWISEDHSRYCSPLLTATTLPEKKCRSGGTPEGPL